MSGAEGLREVGRYTLYAEIASGGMATVHLGKLKGPVGFSRAVAVKAMHPHLVKDPEARAAFIDEARLAARIRHQNVVPTLDVLVEGDEIFLVMDYVHGLSLSALSALSKLPIDVTTAIVASALHGLHAAHEVANEAGELLGVVHRDVSPQNLLIGVDGVTRVADFGVAKAKGRLQSTADGHLKGKLAFMSPEQIQNQSVDRRTDIYAAGVVLWQALTGQRLFVGASEASLLLDVLDRKVKAPSTVAPAVSPELDAIVLRALARDPAERFQTAREMALAIEGAGPIATSSAVGTFVTNVGGAELGRRAAILTNLDSDDGRALPPPTTASSDNARTVSILGPRPTTTRWKPIAFSLFGVVLVAGLVWQSRRDPSPIGPVSASATSPDAPSSDPQQSTEYREAMQAFRDGASSVAITGFEKALTLDSSVGPAHTRLAFLLFFANPDRARSHLMRALQLRASMPAREQALLDAFEPFILRQPSDYGEYERRMSGIAARFPQDAELAYFAAAARSHAATLPERAKALRRVVELDPKFNLARAGLAETELYSGDFDGASRTIRECLRVAPSAVQCDGLLADLHKQSGACKELAADAERLLAVDGSDARSYHLLANALFALGRPESAVREALVQSWRRSDVLRPEAELEDRIALAAIQGNFTEAIAQSTKLDQAVETSRVRGVHASATLIRVALLEEIGDQAGAARAAKSYLERRDGWLADPRREDFAISRDPTPTFAAAARRGKGLTANEADLERNTWIRDWDEHVLPGYRAFVWPHGWAADVDSKERALDALKALPPRTALPSFTPMSLVGADIGRTYLLAERYDEAIPWLERSAKSCAALDFPVEYTRATLWLGRAKEARGDHAGACAAYSAVFARWGHAKPRSISASEAEKRAVELRCKP